MKVWGLTGGIASGKSTTRRMFAARGAHVIDADAVYHALIQPQNGHPSPLARHIAERFGADMVLPDGSIDRVRLGEQVFSHPQMRRTLESLTHPAVAAEVQNTLTQWHAQGVGHAMYDVPLLYERGLEQTMDGVVVVWVPRAVQLARLQARNGFDLQTAEKRLAAQMSLDEKRQRARWVIDNSGDLTQTEAQVDTVWQAMMAA